MKLELPERGGGTTVKTDKKGKWAVAGVAAGNWNVDIRDLSFIGRDPDFVVMELRGALTGQGPVLSLSDWDITTPSGRVNVAGTITNAQPRRRLNLQVQSNPFLFQEWAAIVPGLRRIGVEGAFEAVVEGTADALNVALLKGNPFPNFDHP